MAKHSETRGRLATVLHDLLRKQDINGYLSADIDCHELARAAIISTASSIESRYGAMHPGALFLRRELEEDEIASNGGSTMREIELRQQQLDAASGHIGPLLDAWDHLSNDQSAAITADATAFVACLTALNDGWMGGE